MRKKLLLAAIVVLVVLIARYCYHAFGQDQCLDQGGVWDAQRYTCSL